jgi:hypothetical protein
MSMPGYSQYRVPNAEGSMKRDGKSREGRG